MSSPKIDLGIELIEDMKVDSAYSGFDLTFGVTGDEGANVVREARSCKKTRTIQCVEARIAVSVADVVQGGGYHQVSPEPRGYKLGDRLGLAPNLAGVRSTLRRQLGEQILEHVD